MGQRWSGSNRGIEISDLLPFRIIVTYVCLLRHGIPDDIIRGILSQMFNIQNIALLKEAREYGWYITGVGETTEWHYQLEDHSCFSYNVKENVCFSVEYDHRSLRMPRVFYTRSIRRQEKNIRCLICDKEARFSPPIHPIALCHPTESTCINDFERIAGHSLWYPHSFLYKLKKSL